MGRCVYAVFAVSLFLHLILFWPSSFRSAGPSVTPLVVRFVQIPATHLAAAVVQGSEGEAQPWRAMVPNGAGTEASRGVLSRDVPGLSQAASKKKLSNDEVKAGRQGALLAGSVVLSQPTGSTAEDGAASELQIGRYRLALASAAVRLQQASAISLVGGQAGRSVVVVHVMPEGALPDVRIAESSGTGALDESALALVRRAVSLVQAPVADQHFSVVLPVLFEGM